MTPHRLLTGLTNIEDGRQHTESEKTARGRERHGLAHCLTRAPEILHSDGDPSFPLDRGVSGREGKPSVTAAAEGITEDLSPFIPPRPCRMISQTLVVIHPLPELVTGPGGGDV